MSIIGLGLPVGVMLGRALALDLDRAGKRRRPARRAGTEIGTTSVSPLGAITSCDGGA